MTPTLFHRTRLLPIASPQVAAPVTGLIKLFRNGKLLQSTAAREFSYSPTEPGTYRAEIWLTLDGELRPWIYANPIRLL